MGNTSNDWVVLGRFGKPHGIKGFITVNSYTDPKDNILRYIASWHRKVSGQWQLIDVEHTQANNTLLAKIKGYKDREQIAQLTNVEIAIPKQELPSLKSGEYYWSQLIGLDVVNQNNEMLGIVKEIFPTGSNDVLVVQGEQRHLIPYLPKQVVLSVDIDKKRISVDWDGSYL